MGQVPTPPLFARFPVPPEHVREHAKRCAYCGGERPHSMERCSGCGASTWINGPAASATANVKSVTMSGGPR